MLAYIVSRLGQLIIVLFVVSIVIFVLFRVLIPGDPAAAMLGMEYTEEAYQALRARMGLDAPLIIQYGRWVSGVIRGDLGTSITGGLPVSALVLKRLNVTFTISLVAMAISALFSIIVSLATGYYNNTWFDHVTRTMSMTGICMPTQWLAILLMLFFAVWLRVLPAGGYQSLSEGARAIRFLILPIATLVLQQVATLVRFLRSNVLDVLNADFIRTARSKGLQEHIILVRHALRNCIIPFVTLLGLSFAKMVGGMVIVERVFNIPGLGRLLVRAIGNRDYPVIQAGVLIAAGIYVVINLLVDISYMWIDPRVRYGGGSSD